MKEEEFEEEIESGGGSRSLKSPLLHLQDRGEEAGKPDWMAFFTANLLHDMQASRDVDDL